MLYCLDRLATGACDLGWCMFWVEMLGIFFYECVTSDHLVHSA